MFAPERAHHTKLGKGRFAAQHPEQALVLIGGNAVFGDQRWGDCRITGARPDVAAVGSGHAFAPARNDSITDVNRGIPSVEPRRESSARSGCGIMPRTFPAALTIP